MKASKQNKDGDLIFEAYTSKVNPSPKFDAVIAEGGAKKAAVKGAAKTVKSPEAKSWARGAGDWLRKKFGRKEAKPPTKAETAALKRADRAAKQAAVDAEKAAKKKVLDKQKAKDLKNKPMTAAAKKNLELKGAERVAAIGRAGDTAKALVKPVAIGTAVVGGPAVGWQGYKALDSYRQALAGPDKLSTEELLQMRLQATNDLIAQNPDMSREEALKLVAQASGAAPLTPAGPGAPEVKLPTGPDGPGDDSGLISTIGKTYTKDDGKLDVGKIFKHGAVATGAGIAGKLAYDKVKSVIDDRKKKKEEEEAKKESLYTASYNPQQSKSGYDII